MNFLNNFFKRCFILITLLTFNFIVFPTNSFAKAAAPSVYAPACILMDLGSGNVLYNKNANEKMYPASTTKIMTAILTLENCKLSDTAKASHNAVFSIPSGYSIASIKEGETLTIEQLLNVLLIPSANDAAVVLAEHIAGSVENFANMMNQKALELGCKNTHFVNPNGIHSEDHYSTAYDLALMGKYAMTFPEFRQIVSKTSYALPATDVYPASDRLFNTTNELIRKNYSTSARNYYYEFATGGKTGYTDAAKSCIVATATKGDISLLTVVLHDETTEDGLSQRPIDCKTLFEYGFNNYSVKTLFSKGSTVKSIEVVKGSSETKNLDLVCSSDVTALVSNDTDVEGIPMDITLSDGITAPIAEGTNLGTVSYTIDGVTYSSDLLASHNVYKSNFVKVSLEIILLMLALFIFGKIIHVFDSSKKNKKIKKQRKSTKVKNRKKKSSSTYPEGFYPHY